MSLTKVRLREAWNWGGLSASELARRTWKGMNDHLTFDRAAVIAFYAMLSLVPFLGLVLAIALGAARSVADQFRAIAQRALPEEADRLIEDQITKLQNSPPTAILSIGFLLLLWSASSLFVAVMDATNASYGVQDQRSWLRRHLQAILLTMVESALLLGAGLLIVLWPRLTAWLQLGAVTAILATVVQWLVVLVALLTSFAIAYYFGPDVKQEWEWITPGSTIGVLTLILASLGFRLYIDHGSGYSETYGALAGVVITLLWFYIAALALLLGAEVNCVIEQAAPHGRARGEKVAPQTAGAIG
jgi:membrane protein